MADIFKIFAIIDNTAVVDCPECGCPVRADISRQLHSDRVIKVITECECGHGFCVLLNKKDKTRKRSELAGAYSRLAAEKPDAPAPVTVVDVSGSGLKLRLTPKKDKSAVDGEDLMIGDLVRVEFSLDNQNRSLIQKEAVVRWKDYPYVGVEFASAGSHEVSLGFYA